MIARRGKPDGLPFRLYEYRGARKITYWYKHPDNTREVLGEARMVDKAGCARAKQDAIAKAVQISSGTVVRGSVADMIEQYFIWQEGLPADSELRKASSTLEENKREAKMLDKFFGRMDPLAVKPQHCYAYQDGRISQSAGAKANKELALLSAVFEFGRRRGLMDVNPCRGIKRVPVKPRTFLLSENDLDFAVTVARSLGGSYLIQGLAAKACYLTLKRPSEILSLNRQQITEAGVLFTAAKRKAGQAEIQGLITWSPVLRTAIDEALSLHRHRGSSSFLVFGNQAGRRYTKSGWGTIWRRLMDACVQVAEQQGRAFTRFTLSDCRPAGVTGKKSAGHDDTQDATLHSDGRMIDVHYDQRRVRVAKPVK
ncbi:MAG: hypothetical protein LBI35_01540 [Burkholderiales bacterium]|jgi:integrase|nr:hypothetical protein [Burkholderiales bacterium]